MRIFITVVTVAVIAGAAGWYAGSRQKGDLNVGGPAVVANVPVVTDIRTLNGTVKSVGDNSLVVEANSMNPQESQAIPERTVLTNDSTIIERLKQKDPAIFQKELEAFGLKMRSQSGTSTTSSVLPPEPVIHEKLSLSDIKVGDEVMVLANENIVDAESFTASSVILSAQTSSPAPAPANLGPDGKAGNAVAPPQPQ